MSGSEGRSFRCDFLSASVFEPGLGGSRGRVHRLGRVAQGGVRREIFSSSLIMTSALLQSQFRRQLRNMTCQVLGPAWRVPLSSQSAFFPSCRKTPQTTAAGVYPERKLYQASCRPFTLTLIIHISTCFSAVLRLSEATIMVSWKGSETLGLHPRARITNPETQCPKLQPLNPQSRVLCPKP